MDISNFKLEAEEFNKLQQILSSLLSKTNVDAVFLINRNGQEITHRGETDGIDAVALSSLAASNLAATFGLATILGEDQFERVYLKGEKNSILICPAGEDALLLFAVRDAKAKHIDLRNLKQAVLVLADVLKKCTTRVKVIDKA